MGLNYSELIHRMKVSAGLKNESEIARELGITPQALSNFKKKGEIPTDLVIKFAVIFKLSVDWLLTGKGTMQRTYSGETITPATVGETLSSYNGQDFVFVPRMSGEISAGGGLVADNTIEIRIAFRKDWIQRKGDPNNMSLIRVSGDSMEPTLISGDLVLIDHNRNFIDPQGGIYAISMDSIIMIKRIQLIYTLNRLRIISDNNRYEPLDVDPGQVKINGKVIWFGREIER